MAKMVTFVLSLIAGAIGLFLLPLGLVVPPFILFPLLLGIIALLSSLGASWVSAVLVSNRDYGRLLPIVGITEVAATATALAVVLWVWLIGQLPITILFGVATLIIVSIANMATWRCRSTERLLVKDVLVTAGMIVLGILVCAGAYLLSALFGLIGP